MSVNAIKILGNLLGNGSTARGSGNNALGNLLGSVLGSQENNQQGGISDLLNGLNSGSSQSGGIGNVLGQVLGGNSGQSSQGGGLMGMISGLLGGGNKSEGGLGNMLGDLMGGNVAGGGLSSLLGAALGEHAKFKNPAMDNPNQGEFLPQGTDVAQANEQSELLIRAMIDAAKADGSLSAQEKQNIMEQLGDEVSQEEADFVQQTFDAPLDAQALASKVPNGMEAQLYTVSLTSIDLDNNKEARYLHELAEALGLDQSTVNAIHEKLQVPKIYQ